MKKIFRNFLRFALKSKQETKRIHKTFCRLLKNIDGAKNLLDVGCADGIKTLQYANVLSVPLENVHGIEIRKKVAKIASQRLKVSIINLEKDPFPYGNETFDVVTCNQVFEHLKNIFFSILEMERVLKIGGYLVIGIPNLAALHNRIFLLFGFQPLCNDILGQHIRCFTHRAFLIFLKSNTNFQLVATTGATLYPFPYPIVEFGARLFPGLSAYTFYLLQKTSHNNRNSSRWNNLIEAA